MLLLSAFSSPTFKSDFLSMKPTHIFCLVGLLLLPPFGDISAAEIGDSVPDCSLTSLDSTAPISIKSTAGEVVYLDFWASWCGPCAKSFPFMNELSKKYKDKGFKIVAVNLDENIDDAKAFLAKIPANFTIAVDTGGQCAQRFEVKAMPSSYLIGRDGNIRHIHLGFRSEESEKVGVLVDQLLTEKSNAQ